MVGSLGERKSQVIWKPGLMRVYEDFGVCTRQALRYAMAVHQLELRQALGRGCQNHQENHVFRFDTPTNPKTTP